jgi:hypothetical protein
MTTLEELEKLNGEATEAVKAVDILASRIDDAEIYTAEDAMLDLQAIRRRLPALRAAINALPGLLESAKRVEQLETLLTEIGNYAHDQSTGPAVPDEFWSIRDMAYSGLETSDERRERVVREVGLEAKGT